MRQFSGPTKMIILVVSLGAVAASAAFAATLTVTSKNLSVFRSTATPSPAPPQPCTVTFRSAATASTSSTTLTIPKPAGLVAGDVMVAQVVRLSGVRSMTPTGWTLIAARAQDLGHHFYYKVATSTDAGATGFSWSTAEKATGAILAYSQVDQTTPLNGTPTNTVGDGSFLSAPSITPATTTGMRLALYGHKKPTTLSTPTGMTERYERQNSDAAMTISGNQQLIGTSGATGNKTSIAGEADKWLGQTIALRAATAC